MSIHDNWPILTYNLPTDEAKVEVDAIMLAYLVVFQHYPRITFSEGELKEQAYILCRRLRNQNRASLTNDYLLFCQFFIAYFTAAYRVIVQVCDEDGGEMLRDIEALLNSMSHETFVDLMRLLIFQAVHHEK